MVINGPAHSCNKTSFNDAFRNDGAAEVYRQRILEFIKIPHQLADHCTHALKLYILRSPSFPIITKKHVEAILYLLNKGEDWKPRNQSKAGLREELWPHIRYYMRVLGLDHPRLSSEQQTINYLVSSIMTNLEVNIKENFMKMLLRFINLRLGKVTNYFTFIISFYFILFGRIIQKLSSLLRTIYILFR